MPTNDTDNDKSAIDVDLSAPNIVRDVAAALAAELEETIGLFEASYFVGQVGDDLGMSIGRKYADKLGTLPTEPEALAQLLVDLSTRIGADFSVESATEDEIVLLNDACPFASRVEGHPSLCMTTTNVLGRIVSHARGYANVTIKEAIATGHKRCRVRLCLSKEQSDEGFEFFR